MESNLLVSKKIKEKGMPLRIYCKRNREKDNSSYVSLSGFRGKGMLSWQIADKKVNFLSMLLQSLMEKQEGIVLGGCLHGDIPVKEMYDALKNHVSHTKHWLSSKSLCIELKEPKAVGDFLRTCWGDCGMGSLFVIYAPPDYDEFIAAYKKLSRKWLPDFYEFAATWGSKSTLFMASFDSDMVDFFSSRLSIDRIRNAAMQQAERLGISLSPEEQR